MDLRLGWDLGLEADQVKAQKRLSDEKPHLLILSPMCLAFSQLQPLNTKPDRLAELLEQGRRHLEFACSLAESHVERGGRVLFEHLWATTSWNEPCLKQLLAIDGMRSVRCDEVWFALRLVHFPLLLAFIHGVGVRWSAMDLTGCRCFFLFVPHSLSTCFRTHGVPCTRDSSAAHSRI